MPSLVLLVAACSSSRSEKLPAAPEPGDVSRPPASPALAVEPRPKFEVLPADSSQMTAQGTSFVAPKDWKIAERGSATLLELPEAGSRMAIVDVNAKDADGAVETAWVAYGAPRRKLKLASEQANREGWQETRVYVYETSPSEQREVVATARKASGERWTVVIEDVNVEVIDKRAAQRRLIHSSLLPKGFELESFAGKKARRLGPAEIAELERFVTSAQVELGIPGVAMGVVQDGKVAFAGGFGVRELGKQAPVDENTLFMVASEKKPPHDEIPGGCSSERFVESSSRFCSTVAPRRTPGFRRWGSRSTRNSPNSVDSSRCLPTPPTLQCSRLVMRTTNSARSRFDAMAPS